MSVLAASVIVDLHFDKALDYAVPEELKSSIEVGSFVEIPLRNSFRKGTVIALKPADGVFPLKPIHKLLPPLLDPGLFKLALWMSDYYCTPLTDVLRTILPSSVRGTAKHKEQFAVMRAMTREAMIEGLTDLRKRSVAQGQVVDVMLKVQKEILMSELLEKAQVSRAVVKGLIDKGWLKQCKVHVERSPLEKEEYFPSKPKTLIADQAASFATIRKTLHENVFAAHLLFGVTGSGKTEVYLQLIAEALQSGKGTIMLVPEIALTAQTIERFRSRFEGHIAILHHRLSDGERHDEWKKIQAGNAKIVIGARSAIFSPVPNLGLIIVDEEHESTYKQSDGMPAYHARDVAVMRGNIAKATVVLGSATPSIESFYNCQVGKYTLSVLKTRPEHAKLPSIKLVDMRREFEKKKGFTIFSDELLTGIEKRFKAGEQTILFLNRRGFHTMMLCNACGESVKCKQCDIALTYHKSDNCLSCHLCGFQMDPPPKNCPSCSADSPLKFKGVGTEQVEAALYAIFPDIRVLRLDADTTKHKGSHQKVYRAFRTGKADVLIGTQMIAKGLHFPEVTLVGVLNSDMSISIPDFRASETTFQLLTQVGGRAGRGVVEGEVLIQTSIPDNNVINYAAQQDYEAFFKDELAVRKQFLFPPFTQIAKVRFTGKDLRLTQEVAENYRLRVARHLSPDYEITCLQPSGYAKIKDQHRLHFLIKGPKIRPITTALALAKKSASPLPRSVRSFLDINPSSTYF